MSMHPPRQDHNKQNKAHWLQLHVTTTQTDATAISDFLSEIGALAVSLTDAENQPLFEPAVGETPLWQQVIISALFPADQDSAQLQQQLSQVFNRQQITNYRFSILANQNWQQAYKDHFHSMKFGQRLWICPSWESVKSPAATTVVLDPGLAFGTGSHPTTALCLEWLDQTIKGSEILLDYGCGSGILTIAAAKLGCKHVVAVDHDPQALQATTDNCQRNQLSCQQVTICSPEQLGIISADLLIANILAQPLMELKPRFLQQLKNSGQIALSGILKQQVAQLVSHYQPDFCLKPPVYKSEWALLIGTKFDEKICL